MTELTIGELARASGLGVSALRFYDGAGVLRPAGVDPVNGYRWYAPQQVVAARLIAALRRVGMPLDGIRAVLAGADTDPSAAVQQLERHLGRLEDGLADARRALRAARDLIEHPEGSMTTFTVSGRDLASAIGAVRFAVSTDPEHPELGGILFDHDGARLRLVASDRYRLAVATLDVADADGSAARVIVPVALIDSLALTPDAVAVRLATGDVAIGTMRGGPIDAVFPDWEQLRVQASQELATDATALRAQLAAGPTRTLTRERDRIAYEVSVLRADAGAIQVVDDDADGGVGVNRDFLLEAITAGGDGQLVLALNGPFAPLAIRDPDRADRFSILMPARLGGGEGSVTHS
jgi:DNA polymerase-3 subunit beta